MASLKPYIKPLFIAYQGQIYIPIDIITGNILGLVYGQNGIPKEWRDTVELNTVIEQIAADLVEIPNKYFPQEEQDDYYDYVTKRYPGY